MGASFFFAAGGMGGGGAVSPPGGPGRCPGGDEAPKFFCFSCIKHAKTVIFRVNIG